jgi:hypothetical protein
MESFLYTNPEQLLEEHHHLLFSDFAALASGPIKDKLDWISEIDSALGAASHVTRGSRHAVRGIAEAVSPVHRLSTSQAWWMQRGVCDDGEVANGYDRSSVSLATTLPNLGWSRWSVPCSRLRPLLYFGG